MCSLKLSVFSVLVLVGYVSAAAKPLSFEEIGRALQSFGRKALPVVRTGCGVFNSFQNSPQGRFPGYFQAYPQGYPQINPQRYPQSEEYPLYPGIYPTIVNQKRFLPPPSFDERKFPTGRAFEERDMEKFDPVYNTVVKTTQIQDVTEDFDKVPKVDAMDLKYKGNDIKILKHL